MTVQIRHIFRCVSISSTGLRGVYNLLRFGATMYITSLDMVPPRISLLQIKCLHLAQAYLRQILAKPWQISGKSRENLGKISGKSPENLRQILGQSWTNIRQIFGKSWANLRQFSGKSGANLKEISQKSSGDLGQISGKSQANLV